MPIGAEPSLPPKVFAKFDIKDEVSCDFLVPYQLVWVTIVFFKGDHQVLHFQLDGIHPQCISIVPIDLFRFAYAFRDADTILMRPLPIL